MFKDLDSRTQLAYAIKASEQVYLNWIRNLNGGEALVYSDKNYSLHLNVGNLLLVIWRESGKHPFVSLDIMSTGEGNLSLFVENYFRGVARDTLRITNVEATFDDYLKLANNFPEKAVEQILQSLSDGFEYYGLVDDYNYHLNCIK
jgi:hypothetical protein